MSSLYFQEEEALGKAYDARLMKRLLVYLRPYRPAVVGSVVLLLTASVLQISFVKLTQLAIDNAVTDNTLPADVRLDMLWRYVTMYLGAM
ncbi:MAG: hypothetical protein JSU65_00170, partial [Candidatus Zixiibacteriota bacterium]